MLIKLNDKLQITVIDNYVFIIDEDYEITYFCNLGLVDEIKCEFCRKNSKKKCGNYLFIKDQMLTFSKVKNLKKFLNLLDGFS